MQLLEPLKDELAENYKLAKSTENLITNERDMLQGETEKRIVLYQLSTSVWESVINAGELTSIEEAATTVSEAYRHIDELNTLIEKFNYYGNSIMYSPLILRTTDQYERKQLLDIIAEMGSEAAVRIRDAQQELEQVIQTECPVCGRRFPTRKAMKSHVTQKDDPEHQAMRDRVR